jgi:hypothetical protein
MTPLRLARRRTAVIGGALLALLALAAALEWRAIRIEYGIWRLERAEEGQEADRWLERVIASGGTQALVRKLGQGRPELTHRVFAAVRFLEVLLYKGGATSPMFTDFLPLLRELQVRFGADDELLGLWSRYVPSWWEDVDECSELRRPARTLIGLLFQPPRLTRPGRHLEQLHRNHDGEQVEAAARLLQLGLLGTAWFIGMRPFLEFPSPAALLADRNAGKAWEPLEAPIIVWLREHKPQLRYDPALGRFVLDPAAAPDPRPLRKRGISLPAVPSDLLRTRR